LRVNPRGFSQLQYSKKYAKIIVLASYSNELYMLLAFVFLSVF
jgi:hypothetical protein